MNNQNVKKEPFIHLFQTVSGYYLYDVNRNKFLQISREVYDFLGMQKQTEEQYLCSPTVEMQIQDLKKKDI